MTLKGVVSASIESNDADHIWLRVTRADGEALLLQANASGIGLYKWDESTWSPIWVKQHSLSQVVVEGFTASVGSGTVECSATWTPATGEMMISVPVAGGGASITFSPSRGSYVGYVVVSAPSGWMFKSSESAVIVACARNGSAYVMAASVLESSLTVTLGSLDSSVDQPYSVMVRARCAHS